MSEEQADIKALGRYQIKGVLGQGAMGLVYDGLDPGLNRRVAIKTILTKKLDPEAARMVQVRFEREVRAVARLNHPNIIQVYDFGAEGDVAYIVMEFVQGKELKTVFDHGEKYDLKTTFRIMGDLLSALDMAHEAGIVHRDIKPANVMMTTTGVPKLADFGVARVQEPDANSAEATRVGQIVGTPAYMSPEQTMGAKVDRRSDIFSAGILFYQMLTGKKPFEGTQFALAKKIIEENPVWPSTLIQCSPVIDRIVAKAMEKEPEDRYQTCAKFAEALKRVLEGKQPEEDGEPLPRPFRAPVKTAAQVAQAAAVANEADTEFWNEVKDSDDPDELGLYLEQFPNGAYAEECKRKIAAAGG